MHRTNNMKGDTFRVTLSKGAGDEKFDNVIGETHQQRQSEAGVRRKGDQDMKN